jgi:hypothetical protein
MVVNSWFGGEHQKTLAQKKSKPLKNYWIDEPGLAILHGGARKSREFRGQRVFLPRRDEKKAFDNEQLTAIWTLPLDRARHQGNLSLSRGVCARG